MNRFRATLPRRLEPRQHGSVLSEYLVVLAGLLIVWTGIEVVLELVRLHHDNYAAVLELPL